MFRSFACFDDHMSLLVCIVGGTGPLVLQAVEHGSNEGMARMPLEGGKRVVCVDDDNQIACAMTLAIQTQRRR